MNIDSHKYTHELLNNFLSHGFILTITLPTRVNYKSCTLIDNLYIRNRNYNYFSGVFVTDLSDHYPIICMIEPDKKYFKNECIEMTFRNLSDQNIKCINDALCNIDWSFLENTTLEEGYDYFVQSIVDVIDLYAPLSTKKIF